MPVYSSGKPPVSDIIRSTFYSRLSAVHGFRAIDANNNSDFPARLGMEFVRVDLDNPNYRIKGAALGSVFSSKKLSTNVEKYFDAYVNETLYSYSDIQDRQKRLDELFHFYANSDYGKVAVDLTADEATQLDVQNRIITVESPNLNFTNRVYDLMNLWGLTQNRIREHCWNLELYGESFWVNKIGINGVEKITPIEPNIINEVLEFSPMKMAQYIAQRDGYMSANKNRGAKIEKLMQLLRSPDVQDISDNLADMYDDKLLGYELQDGTVAPPWTISHARLYSRYFFPYGEPPLLTCLSSYKLEMSNIILEGLARQMSFPVTLYKVKTTPGLPTEQQFETVNTTREEYDNIGVSYDSAGGEVYSINTKIWIPDGLVEVDIKDRKTEFNYIDDIQLYRDRICYAAKIPKGYIDPSKEGWGTSSLALMEQYKPFARHVFHIQSAFLEALGNLIRLHFAITGEFDYNTPFLLSMRFPAEEMSDDKRNARTASLDLAKDILELIGDSLGLEDGEPLPEDVITDILSKYTFLDPTDIQKWVRLGSFLSPIGGDDDEEDEDGGLDFGGGDAGGDNFGGDLDMGGGDAGGAEEAPAEGGGDEIPALESLNRKDNLSILREKRARRKKLLEQRRITEITQRYAEASESLKFRIYEKLNMREFESIGHGHNNEHKFVVPSINQNNPLFESIRVIRSSKEEKKGNTRDGLLSLNEQIGAYDMMNQIREESIGSDELERRRLVEEAINDTLL